MERESTLADKVHASQLALDRVLRKAADRLCDPQLEIELARTALDYYSNFLSTWAVSKNFWTRHYDSLTDTLIAQEPADISEICRIRMELDEWEGGHLNKLEDELKKKKEGFQLATAALQRGNAANPPAQ